MIAFLFFIIITIVMLAGSYFAPKDFIDGFKLKKFLLIIPVIWAGIGFSCLERINPGEVGIVVDLFGNERGVEEKELTVGMHWINPWQVLYRFPIFEQNHQWEKEDGFNFQTSEGLSVHADIGITFNLIPTRVHELFCKYRRGMDEITHLFIRNNIRDSINRVSSKMRIDELYGPKKEDFFREVLAQVQTEVEPLGFHISHLYIIGKFVVPDSVMEALNKKIEAIQRAQQRENELKEAEAEARKEIAKAEGTARSKVIAAKAEADALLLEAESKAKANEMVNKSLTSDLLKYYSINKWDGTLPKVMSGGNNMMMLDLGMKEK